ATLKMDPRLRGDDGQERSAPSDLRVSASPRRCEIFLVAVWIPAFAGMTDRKDPLLLTSAFQRLRAATKYFWLRLSEAITSSDGSPPSRTAVRGKRDTGLPNQVVPAKAGIHPNLTRDKKYSRSD